MQTEIVKDGIKRTFRNVIVRGGGVILITGAPRKILGILK
jgi:hypothetical protein